MSEAAPIYPAGAASGFKDLEEYTMKPLWMPLHSAGMLLLFAASAHGQSLAVENVRFTQHTDAKVTITYDLTGDPSQKYAVALSIFLPDSRQKVPIPQRSLSGAVGQSVRPGHNLEIVWDLLRDYPNGLEGDGYRFIIDAFIPKSSSKWPWILAGIAAAGGGTALLLFSGSGDGAGDAPDLPAPPTPPLKAAH